MSHPPLLRHALAKPRLNLCRTAINSCSSSPPQKCALQTSSIRPICRRPPCSQTPLRPFSTSPHRLYKTVEEAKSRHKAGVRWTTLKSSPALRIFVKGVLFLATGAALTVYFNAEKERIARKRIAEHTKGVGKPQIGGPFDLVDHTGKKFTEQEMKGKYALVYFGFSHCPDICPDELDKMAAMIEYVKKQRGNVLRPVMISCDPARDSPAVLKAYLGDFHPDMIGLTGTYDNVKAVCKAYRVYFSTPPNVKPGQDYLVDHSIYFYLMDPDGSFVEALGRNFTADEAGKIISDHIKDWEAPLDNS